MVCHPHLTPLPSHHDTSWRLSVVFTILIWCHHLITFLFCSMIEGIIIYNSRHSMTKTDKYWWRYCLESFGLESCCQRLKLCWAKAPSILVCCCHFSCRNIDHYIILLLCNQGMQEWRRRDSISISVAQYEISDVYTHRALISYRHIFFNSSLF